MKKALALILCLLMLLGVFPATASFADERKESVYTSDLENKVLSDKIAVLTKALISSEQSTVKISSIRTLRDFAGNLYTLIECKPTGYYIFHNASGRFVEYTSESDSPYLGISGDIYYVGPTWYFQKNGTDYTNVMEQTVISLADPKDQNTMADFCDEIHDSLVNNKNAEIVDWLMDDSLSVSGVTANTVNKSQDIAPSFPNALPGSPVYVTNYKFLYNIKTASQIGYINHGGYCGYYALTMLIRYWQNRKGIGLLSEYMNHPISLANQLKYIGRTLGIGNGTWAYNQAKIANKFFKEEKITRLSVYVRYLLSNVTNEILNNKRPTALSAKLPLVDRPGNPLGDHVVVPYGCCRGEYFVMHYGWANYNHVYIDYSMLNIFHSVLLMY